MILQDLYVYFKTDATLSGLLGSSEPIYKIQAPTITGVGNPPVSPRMPWVLLEVTSGSRTKISQTKMEEIAYARVSVDAGPTQINKGQQIIERCQVMLENLRGVITTATDVHVTVGAIRGWAGFNEAYRYQFDATIRFTEDYTQPPVI